MDFIEGLFSFLGGLLRVALAFLEALDVLNLLGWWTLYLIPAPVCGAAAYLALGGVAHQPVAMTGGALAFIAAAVMTFAWARKAETVGFILWGATLAGAVLLVVRYAQS